MSVEASAWALTVRDVSITEKCALLVLADYASWNDEYQGAMIAYPSLQLVAEDSCAGTTAVRQALRRLEERGLLIRVAHVGGGRGHSTVYELPVPQRQRNPLPLRGKPTESQRKANAPPIRNAHAEPGTKNLTDSPSLRSGESARRGHEAVQAFIDEADRAGWGPAARLMAGKLAGQVARAEKAGTPADVIVEVAGFFGANRSDLTGFANAIGDRLRGEPIGRKRAPRAPGEPRGFQGVRAFLANGKEVEADAAQRIRRPLGLSGGSVSER